MASYPYGQSCPEAAGQAPGALPRGYYTGPSHGGGQCAVDSPPGGGYGGPAPGGPYGYPSAGGLPSGTPRGPYGGVPPGRPYSQPPPSSYGWCPPPIVDPEAYSWFQSVDAYHSGYISLKELKQALVNSNWSLFNDETCMMINMFDKTKSDRIDVVGFSALWEFLQQWKSLFQQYDRDRSGSISSVELQQVLSQMDYNLSPQFTSSWCLATAHALPLPSCSLTASSRLLDRKIHSTHQPLRYPYWIVSILRENTNSPSSPHQYGIWTIPGLPAEAFKTIEGWEPRRLKLLSATFKLRGLAAV
ncbi:hypothetical protein ACRRTK_021060 [Alexandromys fortis]